MPWSLGKMNDRYEMAGKWKKGWTKAELAEHFHVSWRTIHKWVSRLERGEENALEDRSRRPHSSPRRTCESIVKQLIKLKKKYPDWGPDKLVDLFPGGVRRMAPSTAGEILKRAGYVRSRRRRRRSMPSAGPKIVMPGSGVMMTADYKGQFRLGIGQMCYPLTICDPASRFILAIDAHERPCGELAGPVFERVFREYGLPDQILTDNGAPFSNASALGGLSELSRDWIKLGITALRIDPGKPQQNGRHERMHKSMMGRATSPPCHNSLSQQKRFNSFRREFNFIRPHDALGKKTPASVHTPYRRQMPRRLPRMEYPDNMLVRRVRSNGQIRWRGQMVFISEVLIGELVGLLETGDGTWDLYFGPVALALWDDRRNSLIAYRKPKQNRRKGVIKEKETV